MRLIDADRLYNTIIDEIDPISISMDGGEMRGMMRTIIAEEPTVDAAPVVHGEWIGEHGEHVPLMNGIPDNSCSCSICGKWLVASDEYCPLGYYCPNCGAKMDEERRENGNHH